MKLENQVCTLQQAKRLKELGVKQESYFWWTQIHQISGGGFYDGTYHVTDSTVFHVTVSGDTSLFSAFTVAELGEMLPKWHFTFKRSNGYGCYRSEKGEFIALGNRAKLSNEDFKTEASARASMLIYLLENNLIKP